MSAAAFSSTGPHWSIADEQEFAIRDLGGEQGSEKAQMSLLRSKMTNTAYDEVLRLETKSLPHRAAVGWFQLPDIDTVGNANNRRS